MINIKVMMAMVCLIWLSACTTTPKHQISPKKMTASRSQKMTNHVKVYAVDLNNSADFSALAYAKPRSLRDPLLPFPPSSAKNKATPQLRIASLKIITTPKKAITKKHPVKRKWLFDVAGKRVAWQNQLPTKKLKKISPHITMKHIKQPATTKKIIAKHIRKSAHQADV